MHKVTIQFTCDSCWTQLDAEDITKDLPSWATNVSLPEGWILLSRVDGDKMHDMQLCGDCDKTIADSLYERKQKLFNPNGIEL